MATIKTNILTKKRLVFLVTVSVIVIVCINYSRVYFRYDYGTARSEQDWGTVGAKLISACSEREPRKTVCADPYELFIWTSVFEKDAEKISLESLELYDSSNNRVFQTRGWESL